METEYLPIYDSRGGLVGGLGVFMCSRWLHQGMAQSGQGSHCWSTATRLGPPDCDLASPCPHARAHADFTSFLTPTIPLQGLTTWSPLASGVLTGKYR